jgi:PAS domain S-box-containing protein
MSISDFETGRDLEVNDAYEKIFGIKREEAVGRSAVELGILENDTERVERRDELKTRGSLRDVEIHTRDRDGRKLTMLHSAELIEIGGHVCAIRVSHDITDRKRAEAERAAAVAREEQARTEYTLQLIASQEAERKRIAAELHDSLGQNLLLIKNLAQMVLRDRKPQKTYEQVTSIDDLAAQCIAEARQISRDLHPYQLDHLGLKRALEAMMENTAQASEIKFAWKFDAVDELFPPAAAMNLYRIVQECLNNIMKHSRAKKAGVRLERDVHEVQLRIEDDGCGFGSDSIAESTKGLGLKNITERARMLGGKLKMDSAPSRGVKITLTIPVPEET